MSILKKHAEKMCLRLRAKYIETPESIVCVAPWGYTWRVTGRITIEATEWLKKNPEEKSRILSQMIDQLAYGVAAVPLDQMTSEQAYVWNAAWESECGSDSSRK